MIKLFLLFMLKFHLDQADPKYKHICITCRSYIFFSVSILRVTFSIVGLVGLEHVSNDFIIRAKKGSTPDGVMVVH